MTARHALPRRRFGGPVLAILLAVLAMPLAAQADQTPRIFGTHLCDHDAMIRTLTSPEGSYASGALAPGEFGRSMDPADHSCVGWTLNRVPSRATVSWENAAGNHRYSVTPTRTYEAADGVRCRDYIATYVYGKRRLQTENTACRDPKDGAWRLGSPYADPPEIPTRRPWAGWAGTPDIPPPPRGPGM